MNPYCEIYRCNLSLAGSCQQPTYKTTMKCCRLLGMPAAYPYLEAFGPGPAYSTPLHQAGGPHERCPEPCPAMYDAVETRGEEDVGKKGTLLRHLNYLLRSLPTPCN